MSNGTDSSPQVQTTDTHTRYELQRQRSDGYWTHLSSAFSLEEITDRRLGFEKELGRAVATRIVQVHTTTVRRVVA